MHSVNCTFDINFFNITCLVYFLYRSYIYHNNMLGSNYGYVFSNCKFDGANYFLKNRDWGIVSRISSERIKQDWNLSAEKGWGDDLETVSAGAIYRTSVTAGAFQVLKSHRSSPQK